MAEKALAKKDDPKLTAVATKPEKTAAELEAEAEAKAVAEAESQAKVENNLEAAMALLADARKLKADDFEEAEGDFFKFEKPGDSVQGVYLGCIDSRIKTHCLGMADRNGQPLMVRINGTKQITSVLGRLAPNKFVVRVEYTGSEKTGAGRTVKKFKIGTKLLKA